MRRLEERVQQFAIESRERLKTRVKELEEDEDRLREEFTAELLDIIDNNDESDDDISNDNNNNNNNNNNNVYNNGGNTKNTNSAVTPYRAFRPSPLRTSPATGANSVPLGGGGNKTLSSSPSPPPSAGQWKHPAGFNTEYSSSMSAFGRPKAPQLETFDGDDAAGWVGQAQRLLDLYPDLSEADKIRFLSTALSDDTAKWLRLSGAATPNTSSEFLAMIRHHFVPEDTARKAFQELTTLDLWACQDRKTLMKECARFTNEADVPLKTVAQAIMAAAERAWSASMCANITASASWRDIVKSQEINGEQFQTFVQIIADTLDIARTKRRNRPLTFSNTRQSLTPTKHTENMNRHGTESKTLTSRCINLMERGLTREERSLLREQKACMRCFGDYTKCGGYAKCTNAPRSKASAALAAAMKKLNPDDPLAAQMQCLNMMDGGNDKDDVENLLDAAEEYLAHLAESSDEDDDEIIAHLGHFATDSADADAVANL